MDDCLRFPRHPTPLRDGHRTGRIAGRVTLALAAALVVVGSIAVLSVVGLPLIFVLAAGSLARVYQRQHRRRPGIPESAASARRVWSGQFAGGPPATVPSPFESPAFWDLTTQESPRPVGAVSSQPALPAWDPLGAAPFAWDLPEPPPIRPVQRAMRVTLRRVTTTAVTLATAAILASDLVGWRHVGIG